MSPWNARAKRSCRSLRISFGTGFAPVRQERTAAAQPPTGPPSPASRNSRRNSSSVCAVTRRPAASWTECQSRPHRIRIGGHGAGSGARHAWVRPGKRASCTSGCSSSGARSPQRSSATSAGAGTPKAYGPATGSSQAAWRTVSRPSAATSTASLWLSPNCVVVP
ncbi:hypothetical protein ACLQ20_28630 [Micromonospora sp. DT46]|uniref:hypothetical protein n=1 Tax=Micromonospora sp. DT46 TaxID=3393435 RepID=UPI003CF5FC4F